MDILLIDVKHNIKTGLEWEYPRVLLMAPGQ
jgi:hypothetical protein